MRCLPSNKIHLCKGRCLHDWHAEVVALRAFNQHLLRECQKVCQDRERISELICLRGESERSSTSPQPFAVRDDVKIYMFCTEAPCGDASMELTMQTQNNDAPWTSHSRSPMDGMLRSGRGHFSELGVVRRKPSRADAPPTLSKSCSDKLSMKQCTSLLSSISSMLIHPGNAYLHELVLPEDQIVPAALERAFGLSGRMAPASDRNPSLAGYRYHNFRISAHSSEFEFAKRYDQFGTASKGSNISAVWTPDLLEVLIGGTKQGFKQFSTAGASELSRWKLGQLAQKIVMSIKDPHNSQLLGERLTYDVLKKAEVLQARREIKSFTKQCALLGWTKNNGDDDFTL